MKSFIALFLGFILSAGSILPHTDAQELCKIPNLIRHYQEHRQASAQRVGFLAFLSLHYGWGSAHAKSHRSDHSIPVFHTHCAGLAFVIPAAIILFAVRVSVLASLRTCIYRNAYVYLFSNSLLRPPRA